MLRLAHYRGGLAPQPEGLVVHVILGISGGLNGVDQIRLDMDSRMPGGTESCKRFSFP